MDLVQWGSHEISFQPDDLYNFAQKQPIKILLIDTLMKSYLGMQLSVYHLIYNVLKRSNIGTDKIFFSNYGLHNKCRCNFNHAQLLATFSSSLRKCLLLGVMSSYID
jgi:hypothetical protein